MSKGRRQKQSQKSAPPSTWQIPTYLNYILIGLAVGAFIVICQHYDLTQDDAYISFRYAENLLNGHGLVFNIGEHVEGFTNFLWVISLAFIKGVFGIDFLAASRVLGVLSAAAIFPLLFLLVWDRSQRYSLPLFGALAVALLFNQSIPYWSMASLETAAFTMIILGALVAEYKRPHLTPGLLVIASLLRPEGVLVFVVILLHRVITEKKIPYRYILIYVIPLIPFAAFKVSYYGSLFPNPYYAKSGVGIEYIKTGLGYLWFFTRTIGLYGVVFAAPLLAIPRLWQRYSLLYVFVGVYIAYIVWVGGDVLMVYRFFVPVVPVLYFLFVISLFELWDWVTSSKIVSIYLTFLLAAGFGLGSYLLSNDHVHTYLVNERGIVDKMSFLGNMLKKHMGDDFSVAASTIGRLGYNLVDHRVIDMLGLTDSCIARNPEVVTGLQSTWKERRFNNTYLLEQQPDFIVFSTGYKPSAPAERALMLHSEFRRAYSSTGFLRGGQYKVVYMRHDSVDISRDVVLDNVDFVNTFNFAYNQLMTRDYQKAAAAFKETWDLLGTDYSMIYYPIGGCYFFLNQRDSSDVYFHRAIAADSNCWEARLRLIGMASEAADSTEMTYQYNKILEHSPWVFDYTYKDSLPGP